MSDQAPDMWNDPAPGRAYPLPDDVLFVPLSDADRKAIHSFWRGLAAGAMVVAVTWWLA